MSKSIFTIDTPENCAVCLFCRGLNTCKLKKYLERDKITTAWTVDFQIIKRNKPNWCPLKSAPEKMDFEKEFEGEIEIGNADEDSDIDKMYFTGRVNGWNACLEEIGVI